ncbi:MAG: hypothetical protein AAF736_10120, partial [Pseudomonadota bacterium]
MTRTTLATIVAVSVFLAISFNQAVAAELLLRVGSIDPTGESDKAEANPAALKSRHGLVQFADADAVDRRVIEMAGAKILAYVPENAYLVRWDKASRENLSAESSLRYVGPWRSDYKVSPTLSRETRKSARSFPVEVMGYPGQSPDALA